MVPILKNPNASHPFHRSSFRDSTYTDTIDGGSEGRNDANGIEQIFEGINRDLVTIIILTTTIYVKSLSSCLSGESGQQRALCGQRGRPGRC